MVVCMSLSCHVRASEWIHTSVVAWMSRNSLLKTGAMSKVYVTATVFDSAATKFLNERSTI